MKYFLFSIGLFSFVLFGSFSSVSAEMKCAENEKICMCEKSWSTAFDAVTEYMVKNEVSVFLTQNDIAPGDMWSGFRALSLKNRCLLGAVCKMVESGADAQHVQDLISPQTALGGSFPGPLAACSRNTTFLDIFEKLPNGAASLTDIRHQCRFSSSYSEEGSSGVSEQKSEKDIMYKFCTQHLELNAQIFDRTIRNLIWKDVTRKITGYFAQKVLVVRMNIQALADSAQQFATTANTNFGMLCTLSSTD